MITQFVNNGTDLEVLNKSYESMPLEQQEELAKALKKDGLVLVDVQVRGKHGTYTRKQWKKASDVKKDEGKSSKGAPDTMSALNSVSVIDAKSQRALAAALDAAPVGTKIETGMNQMGFPDKGKVSWEKKDSSLSGSKPWVKTGGSNSGFTDTPTGVAQQIASMKARPDKCGKPDFKVHTPDSKDKAGTKQSTDQQNTVPQVIKGKHMSDLKDNLREHGLVLDGAYGRKIRDDEEVIMYDKDKNTYTAKANVYSDGGVELRKITKENKEETVSNNDKQHNNSKNLYPDYVNKTNVGVPKAHSSSYFSEKKAIEFAKQLHDNGATNIEISSAKDGFNQTQYRVAWDKEEKKQSTQKNTDKSSANISQKDLDEATSFLGDKDKRSWYYVHTPQEFKSGSLKFGSTITMAIDDIMRPLTSKEKRDQVTVNTVVAYLQERYSKTGGVLGKITKDDLKDIQGNLDKYRDGKLWGVKYHNGKDSNGNVIGDNQAKTTKKVAATSKVKQNSSSDSSKITNIKPTKPTHGTYAAESNLMDDEGEIDQTYTGKINGEEVEIYRVGDKLLAAYVDDDGNEIFYTSSGKDPSKANWENIGEDYDKAGKHLISGLSKDSSNVSVPKTKADIQSMLASGKSRNDIIELAKKSGISWKENGHEGINWMRCCMALTKASK